MRPIVAIDGPVGAGKSTVARALARALGFEYLNTGAMYRAVAIAAREAGIDGGALVSDGAATALEARLRPLLEAISIELAGDRVLLDGRDITAATREPAIGDLASRLSALAPVRARLQELQRAAGAAGGVVMEGRDIGTVIFPDAEIKFFLVADVAERARRRWAELTAKGVAIALAEVRAELEERDRRDAGRALDPLRAAPDAIEIDSTARGVEQVVNAMCTRVNTVSHVLKGLKRA
ncbi:MAG TPA: (d)CMP kinase [Candidatus Binataceae bacterium]|nr:(d)CMP kinase [Candidatus Binataceae bacterium]HVC44478.1 (d)CMP kinase [Candidatus Binataceae bacterium]